MWYYLQGEDVYGPYDQDAFLTLIVQGEVTSGTYVLEEGSDDWVTASDSLWRSHFEIEGTASDADEIKALQKEVKKLKQRLSSTGRTPGPSSVTSSGNSIAGMETFTLRIDGDNIIDYVNTPLCDRFNLGKDDLIGKDMKVINGFMEVGFYGALVKAQEAGNETLLETVRTAEGSMFEIRVTANEGMWDVVIQDVTDEYRFKDYVSKYVSTDLASMPEEDLETFKFPERRYMSVSFTDLRGFTAMSESMTPEEVRATMNAYLDAVIKATEDNKAYVDKIVGDEVMALYGAPKYYNDHALRSVITACDQIAYLNKVQREFEQAGKNMPGCGIGVNTGDMVLGNMGGGSRQDYTVLGSAVNLAARLCGAARSGEVLVTENTMHAVLEGLPDGWGYCELKTNDPYDLEGIGGKTEAVDPLPEHQTGLIVGIGEGMGSDGTGMQLAFRYAYMAKVKGVEHPIPILSMQDYREEGGTSASALSDETAERGGAERIFGKYRFLERIGKGGMGEVWKARDAFGNTVAVKLLLAGEGASENQIKRFKREAEIMAKLQHSGICRIFEMGEVDKVNYIAMEYVDGVSLSDILKYLPEDTAASTADEDLVSLITIVKDRASVSVESPEEEAVEATDDRKYHVMPIQQTLSIMIKSAEAVQYAHEHGILHRDLKPANIMIRSDGSPVVMDFGLAKMDTSGKGESSLSVSGQIVGTIEYMSPEQAENSREASESADVYSLGAILYQMITGRRHFKSTGNILTDANNLKHHMPEPPNKLNPGVDKDLEVITIKALMPEKGDRYPSVQGLREDLTRFRNGEVISAKSVTPAEIFWKWCKRNKALSGTVAACLLLLIVGAASAFVVLLGKERSAREARDDALAAQASAEEERRNAESAKQLAEKRQLEAEHSARLAAERQREVERALEEIKKKDTALNVARVEGEKREKAIENLQLASANEEQTRRAVSESSSLLFGYKIEEARRVIDVALEEVPESANAWFMKGQIELLSLNGVAAHDAFENAVKYDSDKIEATSPLMSIAKKMVDMKKGGGIDGVDLYNVFRDMRAYSEHKPFLAVQNVFEKLADDYASGKADEGVAINAFVDSMKDTDAFIKNEAYRGMARLISKLGDDRASALFLRPEFNNIAPYDKLNFKNITDLDTLIAYGRKNDRSLREKAYDQIGEMTGLLGDDAIRHVLKNTRSGESGVREAPFVYLSKKAEGGNQDALNSLLDYLQHNDAGFKEGASVGLGYAVAGQGNDNIEFMLSDYIDSDSSEIRYWAIRAIGYGAHGVADKPGNKNMFALMLTLTGQYPRSKQQLSQVLEWLAVEKGNEEAATYLGR